MNEEKELCICCSKELIKRQRKFCSLKCQREYRNKTDRLRLNKYQKKYTKKQKQLKEEYEIVFQFGREQGQKEMKLDFSLMEKQIRADEQKKRIREVIQADTEQIRFYKKQNKSNKKANKETNNAIIYILEEQIKWLKKSLEEGKVKKK